MRKILEARGLKCSFQARGRSFLAVDGADLDLYEGEVLGLIGASGCGKSTLARLLTRLTPLEGGELRFMGEDVLTMKDLRPFYRAVQMVFQTPAASFDPRRTLGDGITESLKNLGLKKSLRERRGEELLIECGLSPAFMRRYPHEVSGGECQRAAIARALAPAPKVIILDEATSSLDTTVQRDILELLTRLKSKEKLSYLFITHSLALVQELCDRVLVMHAGRIVEEGTPDEIIHEPKSAYTRELVEAAY